MGVLRLRHTERAATGSQGHEHLEDAVLVDRFLGGDDDAFLELFRRHNPRLVLYARKITGELFRAEDVVQEAWERLVMLRSTRERLRNPIGFLLRVVRNLCIDHLRSLRHHARLDDVPEASHPRTAEAEEGELTQLVLAGLEQLPFEMREVLVLNAYSGYPFQEIAVMLGKTPEAIWARASRARARLRTIVAAAMTDEMMETSEK